MMRPDIFFVGSFLAVTVISSFVMNAVRLREPRAIVVETTRLAATIVFWIAVFAFVVWVLEWILIRPLI
jgi:hypothetical protein